MAKNSNPTAAEKPLNPYSEAIKAQKDSELLAKQRDDAEKQGMTFLGSVFKLATTKKPGEAIQMGLQLAWATIGLAASLGTEFGNQIEKYQLKVAAKNEKNSGKEHFNIASLFQKIKMPEMPRAKAAPSTDVPNPSIMEMTVN